MALLAVEKVDVDCSAVGDVAAGRSVLVRGRGGEDGVRAYSEMSRADRREDMADR